MKNFSSGTDIDITNASGPISRAAKGLVYISETDSEVFPVTGGQCDSVTAEAVLKLSGAAGNERVEQVSADEFFDRLTKIRDWHGEREKARVRGFAKLSEVLKHELRDLKVFRIGAVQIDIYAVGIDAEGRLAGVMTKAVET